MTVDPPVPHPEAPLVDPATACTLPPSRRAERLAWIRREITPRVRASERLRDGLALELASFPGIETALARWIELERACCSGLALQRFASAVPGQVRLEIRGLDPDAPIVRSLVPATPPARGRRPCGRV